MAQARSKCYSRFEMNRAKYLIIAAIVFLLVPVVGCSERLNLREVTANAITATCEAQSHRASAVQTYTVDGKIEESTSESEFVAPDRFHNKTSGDGKWSEIISIGDKSYIRGSDIPEWCESPCQYRDPSSGSTVTVEAASISLEKELESLNWLVDLEQLPDEVIDGINCWHYRGKVDMDAYVDMLQKTTKSEDGQFPEHLEEMRRWMRNFELWVEKDSYLIRQLKSEERFAWVNPDTGEESLFTGSTTKQFYDFNEPISIKPPQM